jgi:uncharacterized spore protein YtfJ
MEATDVIAHAQDSLTVRRVFGEPITADGVTVIPAARLGGGGGAGSGTGEPDGERPAGSGNGGGYGLGVVPVGALVIRDGGVSWRPAVDVNKVILGGQLVAVVALLTLRSYLKLRARRD